MTDRDPDRLITKRTRRTLLGAIAAGTAGLAGCLGGGNGDGGGGDTPSDGDLETLQVPDGVADGDSQTCSPLVEGYTRYDGGDTPFVATFEHPGSVAASASANDEYSLTVRGTVDGQAFDMFPTMNMSGTESRTAPQNGEVSGLEVVGGIDYAGETLPVVRASAGSNGDDGATRYVDYPYYVVGVPHEGSAGKRYYRYDFRATVQFGDLETGDCEATWERAARRMIASLEPNSGTTIDSE